MGVDTKGCVVTEDKDAFKVAEIVENWWNKVKKENNLSLVDFRNEEVSDWKMPKIEMGVSKSLQLYFRYKGENRRIFINFDCDCDLGIYDEIEGTSCIWFSMGNWGSSVEIMQSLMEEFKVIGECYVDENDCDDKGFYKV